MSAVLEILHSFKERRCMFYPREEVNEADAGTQELEPSADDGSATEKDVFSSNHDDNAETNTPNEEEENDARHGSSTASDAASSDRECEYQDVIDDAEFLSVPALNQWYQKLVLRSVRNSDMDLGLWKTLCEDIGCYMRLRTTAPSHHVFLARTTSWGQIALIGQRRLSLRATRSSES